MAQFVGINVLQLKNPWRYSTHKCVHQFYRSSLSADIYLWCLHMLTGDHNAWSRCIPANWTTLNGVSIEPTLPKIYRLDTAQLVTAAKYMNVGFFLSWGGNQEERELTWGQPQAKQTTQYLSQRSRCPELAMISYIRCKDKYQASVFSCRGCYHGQYGLKTHPDKFLDQILHLYNMYIEIK